MVIVTEIVIKVLESTLTFKNILCIFKIQTSQFSTISDYYYLVIYHDYASLLMSSFPRKNILDFNNINKSTLGLLLLNHIRSK